MRKAQKKQILDLLATLAGAHKEILQTMDDGNFNLAGQLLEDCQNAAIQIGTMIEESEGEGFVTVGILEGYCELAYQIHERLQAEGMGQEQTNASNLQSGVGLANARLETEVAQDAAGMRNSQTKSGLAPSLLNPRKLQKVLQKHLIRIENSVKNDIPVRTEAVFLPYKASMWDSLESVWMAANEDPDCDAYVIPIPYYDRNPNGTFGKLHDESALYPDYVPVTNYNKYDFAAQRPDMIFIHNPYDDENFVTSVHPFFYSENLKKYTDRLVYIPYFIEKEFEPGDKRAMEHMEHFVLCPGVIHAHYVVVQSEAMRQIYIDILTRHSGEATRSFWEGRVLGLGSPKMDRVLTAREEDFEIPEDWKQHIYKNHICEGGSNKDDACGNNPNDGNACKDGMCEDDANKYDASEAAADNDHVSKGNGDRKKVIFYNTSIGAFLQHGEKMLEKMQSVFKIFEQEQENITLLWRPHPLLPTTIKSMRPKLYMEYEKIVEKYRAGDWGIYDDSTDLNRAIAVSDAYYGDPSSVVELFKKVGKPVMIQNPNIHDNIESPLPLNNL